MPAGDYVVLSVKDNGCGMDNATKSRIFEPFFTTKSEGKGTGLGLATVYGVVKQSGGYIAVDSEPGQGARFEIYLPRVLGLAANEAAESPANISSLQKSKTVLIAEDEDEVRELASRFLQSAGYRVLAARDGAEALAIAKQSKKEIHALVTDVVMPQVRGPELARELKKIYPKLKVLYMSGYVENRGVDGVVFDENSFLQKPFSRETLVAKVSQVLDSEPAERPSALTVPRSVRVN